MTFAECFKNLYNKNIKASHKTESREVGIVAMIVVGLLLIALTVLAAMLLSGCKGIDPTTTVKSTTDTSGVQNFKDIKNSTITLIGIDLPSIIGVGTSSMTFNTPIDIHVLDKYDSPVVKIDEVTLYKSETIPKDTKVIRTKVYRSNSGQIVRSDSEIYEPVNKTIQLKGIWFWLTLAMLVNGLIGTIGIIVIIAREIIKNRKKSVTMKI